MWKASILSACCLTVSVTLFACNAHKDYRGELNATSLLIGKDGRSNPLPSDDIWKRLYTMSDKEEQGRYVDAVLDLIENDVGYARAAAVRALLDYTANKDTYHLVTQRFVDVMGNTIVRLNRQTPSDKFDIMKAYMTESPYLSQLLEATDRWFETPYYPSFDIRADGLTIPFEKRLVTDWEIGGRIRIFLDGKLVREARSGRGEMKIGSITVKLAKLLGEDSAQVVGRHVWKVEAQLFAPNGLSTVVVDEWELMISK